VGAVAHAGGVLLTRTAYATGLSGALSDGLAGWRKPLAVHDPAKVLTDLAISLVLGGDALCDAALLRAEPTISRTITTLSCVSVRVALGRFDQTTLEGSG